jgi:hypothetical protein
VAAFVDNELVDPVQLEAALADAGSRAYLIDLLVLRGLVEGRGAEAATTPASRSWARSRSAPSRVGSIARRWSVAAAIATVSLVGGYFAGQYDLTDAPVPAGIQRSPDVVGPQGTGDASPIEAPAPTSVIRLEPGVDWQDQQEQGSGS